MMAPTTTFKDMSPKKLKLLRMMAGERDLPANGTLRSEISCFDNAYATGEGFGFSSDEQREIAQFILGKDTK